MAIRDDALSTLTPIEGDYVPLRIDANGALWTHDDALDAALSGSELQVDIVGALPTGSNTIGTVTANAGTNLNTSALALETTATDIARFVALVELSDTIVAGAVSGGEMIVAQGTASSLNVTASAGTNLNTSALALETTATDIARFVALVELADTVVAGAVVGGEMVVAQGTASSLNAQMVGNVAHDAAASGNPLQVAGEARSTERAAVASADVSRLITDLAGKLITLPYANPEIFLRGREETTSAGNSTQLIAAQGASTRIYVTSLLVNNDSATNTSVNLQEGSSTILATIPAPTVGGAVISFPVPIKLTENAALGYSVNDAVSTITVTALGYSGA